MALTSVKVSAPIADAARFEAPAAGRSIGSQVDYWARLGRAFEASQSTKIKAVLDGRYDESQLTDAEYALLEAQRERLLSEPSDKERAFFAQLIERGGGVGYDDNDRLVRGTGNGKTEVIG